MDKLRLLTAGESHGRGLMTILEGVPAGLELLPQHINADLARRQKGFGRGGRMQIEEDAVEIISGIRHGTTLGSPIGFYLDNDDWPTWEVAMSPLPVADLEQLRQAEDHDWRLDPVTRPRPGHADLTGALKYNASDMRHILERSSARETTARVAAAAVARRLLAVFGIDVQSYVLRIGGAAMRSPAHRYEEESGQPALDPKDLKERTEASPVRCPDPETSDAMVAAIKAAGKQRDTVGGVFEVLVTGVPAGLGSHVMWDRRLEGRLAQSLMSINAIKGVEVGLGFEAAARRGSQVHDPIYHDDPQAVEGIRGPAGGFHRRSNGAGGIEGGITNGEPLLLKAAMKPINTLAKPLASADLITKEPFEAHHERSDICAVPAAAVIGEAVVALDLAAAFLEKFGGDHVDEIRRSFDAFCRQMAEMGDPS